MLHTYSAPTSLQAEWTANTININFYSDENTVYSTGTCTYDGGIELPETDPTRTGYTFDGWQVRRAAAHAQQCLLANYSLGKISADPFEYEKYKSLNYPSGNTNDTSLDVGEWTYPFTDGLVKGIASCNNTSNPAMTYFIENLESLMKGDMTPEDFFAGFSQVATEEQFQIIQNLFMRYISGSASMDEIWATVFENLAKDENAQFSATATGQYCWCKATSFTPTNGEACNLSGTYWIYHSDMTSTSNCASYCAEGCSNAIWDFGKNFFGLYDE